MSGIYGYMLNNNTSTPNLSQTTLWNNPYGKVKRELQQNNRFALGCALEKLSNQTVDKSVIFHDSSCYAVIDSIIFNRDELINNLNKNYTIKILNSFSDEKLLFTHYLINGPKGLAEINGDFAGAVYDDSKTELLLFRNHLGTRPLYYYIDQTAVFFSTDIRGLVALPQVNTDINEKWLYMTVSGLNELNTTETEFANIHCVPPGCYMIFKQEKGGITFSTHKYWEIGAKKIHLSSEKAYQTKLRELIADSVQRRLDAVDGLIGAELSGGLDSSVIDILINRSGRKAKYFSWSASPEELPLVKNDERNVIFDICKQENIECQFDHIKIELGDDSTIANTLHEMGFTVDSKENMAYRFILSPTMNTLPICEAAQYMAKAGSKVVFTGHGGDEGVSHRCSAYEMFYYHEYYRYLRHMWSLTHGQKHRIKGTLKACYNDLWKNRKFYHGTFRSPFGAPQLFLPEFAKEHTKEDKTKLTFSYDPIAYIRSGGSRNRLDVVSVYGAMNGVRYLAPYLDYRVVDYAVSIPRYLYLRGRRNRYIFREAFKDIMPKSLYVLQNKRDESIASIEEDPNWFEKFAEDKKKVYDRLDRNKWEKYFDYDLIDKWVVAPKPETPEKRTEQENIYYGLYLCSIFDNLVAKVRGIN